VSHDLDRRLAALAEAVRLAEGRLDEEPVVNANSVVAKAGARLGFGIENTVVALAGSTGVGKSQLFNALSRSELAAVSRRRPTTAVTQAAVWGDGADPLLDWLEVPRRHGLEPGELEGLVLLDLPDFDSVEFHHRDEADRVVALADLVLWVAEPQKYADAALHDRYLRPLASHANAMAVALNQSDLLSRADIAAWRNDMARLLAEDGLQDIPIVVVSARTGAGLEELRQLLRERVAARRAAVERLEADVADAAGALASASGTGTPAGIRGDDRARLFVALEDAAGVRGILHAVSAAHRRRGALATGWPFVRWILRFRPDPLRRLRLPEAPQPSVRTSRPAPTDVQRAQVGTATRALADGATEGLPAPWPRLARDAATNAEDALPDRLDRAVASTDLHVSRPRWWRVAAFVQRVFAAATILGMLWLLALAVLGYLHVDEVVPLPELWDVPIPTWLLLGGIAAGLASAFAFRVVNALSARRRVRSAARSLRRQIGEVAEELVLGPLEAELESYGKLRDAVEVASSGRQRHRIRPKAPVTSSSLGR
jgi:GTP-binding protein EngB required for normal cell division